MYDYLIIGGGITGITCARLLQQRGVDSFVILEAQEQPGGLCRSKEIAGHVLDLSGGHFLCTRFPEVYAFIFDHLPKSEFNFFTRVSKIKIDSHIIDYPIESNLWQLPIEVQLDFLLATLNNGQAQGMAEPHNYRDWILWKLGREIATRYMLPYNQKIWGVSPEEMDIDWLRKIPVIDTREILRACLSREMDRSYMPSHAGFYYPKRGGFQSVFDALHAPVADRVALREPVTSLERKSDHWLVNRRFQARNVVNTAPWPHLYQALGEPQHLKPSFDRLRYNSIAVHLWERPYSHDWHWLYIPDESVDHHREFFIHNFAPHSRPGGVFTETNFQRLPPAPQKHRRSDGLTPLHEHRNEVAYPIPVLGHAAAIRQIIDHFEPLNLFGLGRWGQWQYFNSDVCIHEVMKFVNGRHGA